MEVAAGVMSPLLRKLGELLVGEFNLEKQVKEGIKSLETELTLMHATLLKVGDMRPDQLDMTVRIWAGKVRELSCDMEDAVDRFVVRMKEGCDGESTNMKNRVKKLLRKTTRLFTKGKALHQISNAIQEAQNQAKGLAELRDRYKLENSTSNGANIDPRLKDMHKDVIELVGIEEARDELIQRLTEGDEGSRLQLKTISIVGFGGLGKTTLAKAVYDKIKVQFNCVAFVSVSQTPDMNKVLKNVMYELDKANFGNIPSTMMDETALLISELRDILWNKRYLIIIDDIWDKEAWGVIKSALCENSLGSRIITTTRKVNVAEACHSSNDHMIHKMRPLSGIYSHRLFYRRIFGSEMGCPDELQEVSRDILKKCGGVPLAIITIASLLASNQGIKSKNQWCDLLKSIGRGLTEGAIMEDMKWILSLSYYDLPSPLKPCLLYLSIFPEDHEIGKERLIWRWIAEGFIHPGKQETSLLELGERYFNELVNRSMIQPIYRNYEDRPYGCRVHDMVLDLICGLSSEDNFVSIFDGIRRSIHDSQSKVRRLSLQNSSMAQRNTHQLGTTSMSQVRSVSLFMPAINLMPSLSRFEVLRVLDLEDCDLCEREDKIGLEHLENLLHLRYLGLRGTCIGHLPLEIGKLQFLQTLDIRGTKIEELPSSVVRLGQLMRLHVVNIKVPTGLGNLVSLEELDLLDVSHFSQDDFQELGRLTELRVLELYFRGQLNESECKGLAESIENMHKLQSLKLYGDSRINFAPGGWAPPPQLHTFITHWRWFSTLPKWINHASLPLLSHLQIEVDEARWEDIQILGKLPALRFLCLSVDGSMEERAVERGFVVTADAFPCLRVCEFLNFVTAPSMFPRGAMPMLQHFEFGCRARDIASGGLDVSMGHLPSLERVKVDFYWGHASDGEAEAAEGALRHAAEAHPNRPTLLVALMDMGEVY